METEKPTSIRAPLARWHISEDGLELDKISAFFRSELDTPVMAQPQSIHSNRGNSATPGRPSRLSAASHSSRSSQSSLSGAHPLSGTAALLPAAQPSLSAPSTSTPHPTIEPSDGANSASIAPCSPQPLDSTDAVSAHTQSASQAIASSGAASSGPGLAPSTLGDRKLVPTLSIPMRPVQSASARSSSQPRTSARGAPSAGPWAVIAPMMSPGASAHSSFTRGSSTTNNSNAYHLTGADARGSAVQAQTVPGASLSGTSVAGLNYGGGGGGGGSAPSQTRLLRPTSARRGLTSATSYSPMSTAAATSVITAALSTGVVEPYGTPSVVSALQQVFTRARTASEAQLSQASAATTSASTARLERTASTGTPTNASDPAAAYGMTQARPSSASLLPPEASTGSWWASQLLPTANSANPTASPTAGGGSASGSANDSGSGSIPIVPATATTGMAAGGIRPLSASQGAGPPSRRSSGLNLPITCDGALPDHLPAPSSSPRSTLNGVYTATAPVSAGAGAAAATTAAAAGSTNTPPISGASSRRSIVIAPMLVSLDGLPSGPSRLYEAITKQVEESDGDWCGGGGGGEGGEELHSSGVEELMEGFRPRSITGSGEGDPGVGRWPGRRSSRMQQEVHQQHTKGGGQPAQTPCLHATAVAAAQQQQKWQSQSQRTQHWRQQPVYLSPRPHQTDSKQHQQHQGQQQLRVMSADSQRPGGNVSGPPQPLPSGSSIHQQLQQHQQQAGSEVAAAQAPPQQQQVQKPQPGSGYNPLQPNVRGRQSWTGYQTVGVPAATAGPQPLSQPGAAPGSAAGTAASQQLSPSQPPPASGSTLNVHGSTPTAAAASYRFPAMAFPAAPHAPLPAYLQTLFPQSLSTSTAASTGPRDQAAVAAAAVLAAAAGAVNPSNVAAAMSDLRTWLAASQGRSAATTTGSEDGAGSTSSVSSTGHPGGQQHPQHPQQRLSAGPTTAAAAAAAIAGRPYVMSKLRLNLGGGGAGSPGTGTGSCSGTGSGGGAANGAGACLSRPQDADAVALVTSVPCSGGPSAAVPVCEAGGAVHQEGAAGQGRNPESGPIVAGAVTGGCGGSENAAPEQADVKPTYTDFRQQLQQLQRLQQQQQMLQQQRRPEQQQQQDSFLDLNGRWLPPQFPQPQAHQQQTSQQQQQQLTPREQERARQQQQSGEQSAPQSEQPHHQKHQQTNHCQQQQQQQIQQQQQQLQELLRLQAQTLQQQHPQQNLKQPLSRIVTLAAALAAAAELPTAFISASVGGAPLDWDLTEPPPAPRRPVITAWRGYEPGGGGDTASYRPPTARDRVTPSTGRARGGGGGGGGGVAARQQMWLDGSSQLMAACGQVRQPQLWVQGVPRPLAEAAFWLARVSDAAPSGWDMGSGQPGGQPEDTRGYLEGLRMGYGAVEVAVEQQEAAAAAAAVEQQQQRAGGGTRDGAGGRLGSSRMWEAAQSRRQQLRSAGPRRRRRVSSSSSSESSSSSSEESSESEEEAEDEGEGIRGGGRARAALGAAAAGAAVGRKPRPPPATSRAVLASSRGRQQQQQQAVAVTAVTAGRRTLRSGRGAARRSSGLPVDEE